MAAMAIARDSRASGCCAPPRFPPAWRAPTPSIARRMHAALLVGLGNDTALDVVRLDQQVMQLAVPQGRIELHLRQFPEGNTVEVDIPRGGVWLLQPGIYDIAAGAPDRPGRIMVFDGSARFVGGTVDIAIQNGEAAVIGGPHTPTATVEKAPPDALRESCPSTGDKEQ